MSLAAGLDDAEALAQWILGLPLADGIDLPHHQRTSLFAVTDAVVGRDPERALELRALVAGRLVLQDEGFALTPALISVVHAPSKLVITYNYDELIEAAAADQEVPFVSVTQEDSDVLLPLIGGDLPDVLTIFHIHGSVRGSPDDRSGR